MNQDLSNNDISDMTEDLNNLVEELDNVNDIDSLDSLDTLNNLENVNEYQSNIDDPSIQLLSNILFNRPTVNQSSIFFDIPNVTNMTNNTSDTSNINIPNPSNPSTENIPEQLTDTQLNQAETYLRFIEDLLQLPPIPIGQSRNNLHSILQQTLNQKNAYKTILSEEGEKAIEKIMYNTEEHKEQTTCPIMQMDFEEGEEVAKLPCGHLFYHDAILRWLKEEKAECPTCRYKMPSFEKKIEPPQTNTEAQSTVQNQTNIPQTNVPRTNVAIRNTVNIPFNRAPGQHTHPFGRILRPSTNRQIHFRNLVRTRQQMDEEQELQAALLASLEDQYMNPTTGNNDENKNKNMEINVSNLSNNTSPTNQTSSDEDKPMVD